MTGVMVPAGPARNHVRQLIGQGMSQQAICRAADVTASALSALIHGAYEPGRPPQKTIYAPTADRLLAVRHDTPAPLSHKALPCAPGARFDPVGYRVGRCRDCGQVAPLQTRAGQNHLVSHPPAAGPDAWTLGNLPVPAGQEHPDCGTPRGHSRHRREKTVICQACAAAKRGYEQGVNAGAARERRQAATQVPAPLVEQVVAAMRAVLYRRPYPQLRQLATAVVRIADAELYAEEAA